MGAISAWILLAFVLTTSACPLDTREVVAMETTTIPNAQDTTDLPETIQTTEPPKTTRITDPPKVKTTEAPKSAKTTEAPKSTTDASKITKTDGPKTIKSTTPISASRKFIDVGLLGIEHILAQIRESENNDEGPIQFLPNIPKEVYHTGFSLLSRMEDFANSTLREVVRFMNELETWEAPAEIRKNYPYYWAGYDYEDRPVWVGELGKFDFRAIVDNGPERIEIMEKYAMQGCLRVFKSLHTTTTLENNVAEAFFLADMDHFSMRQVTHLPTIEFAIKMFEKYIKLITPFFGGVIVINVNYAAEVGVNFLRPILGPIMEKVEIFGVNPPKWKARLQKVFPRDTIPTWYGGGQAFRPVAAYG